MSAGKPDEARAKFDALIAEASAAAQPGEAQEPATRALIEQCRAALSEELTGWDIDPPLHHVLTAHDACVAWLAAPVPPARQQEARDEALRLDYVPLCEFAAAHRIPYNKLCAAVHDALTPPAPGAQDGQ